MWPKQMRVRVIKRVFTSWVVAAIHGSHHQECCETLKGPALVQPYGPVWIINGKQMQVLETTTVRFDTSHLLFGCCCPKKVIDGLNEIRGSVYATVVQALNLVMVQ
jgi:hypothetical protein